MQHHQFQCLYIFLSLQSRSLMRNTMIISIEHSLMDIACMYKVSDIDVLLSTHFCPSIVCSSCYWLIIFQSRLVRLLDILSCCYFCYEQRETSLLLITLRSFERKYLSRHYHCYLQMKVNLVSHVLVLLEDVLSYYLSARLKIL